MYRSIPGNEGVLFVVDSENIHVGKALVFMALAIVFMMVVPYIVITYYMPTALLSDPFRSYLLNSLMIWGAVGGVSAFFCTLFSPGTRQHGLFSIIFAAFSVYYTLFLFTGGFSGEFGVFTISFDSFPVPTMLQSFSFGIDLSLIAWWLIISGGIMVLVYLYEITA